MSLEDRRIFNRKDLIHVEDLRKRWHHATLKEIFELNAKGLLSGFSPTKAPIDDVWFCEEAHMESSDSEYVFADVDFFLLSDVLKCEKKYPDFTGYTQPPEETASKESSGERSSEYGKECLKLLHIIEEKNAEIKKLEGKLAKAANAEIWEQSVIAAFNVWIDILGGKKKDWKRDEFNDRLSSKYSKYHTIVQNVAWRFLPKDYKHGRGRPSQKKE